ncbi:MAG: hypothetical protein CO065_03440 [Comamonadaceae bacterium CG_4_9_14_0_8_um_filter_57_21]|nr:MAG: hypothetical protein CO065_03440 [Comamonadaceae bacterium CG_4_9_14_0_8_um_filter_57_21]
MKPAYNIYCDETCHLSHDHQSAMGLGYRHRGCVHPASDAKPMTTAAALIPPLWLPPMMVVSPWTDTTFDTL